MATRQPQAWSRSSSSTGSGCGRAMSARNGRPSSASGPASTASAGASPTVPSVRRSPAKPPRNRLRSSCRAQPGVAPTGATATTRSGTTSCFRVRTVNGSSSCPGRCRSPEVDRPRPGSIVRWDAGEGRERKMAEALLIRLIEATDAGDRGAGGRSTLLDAAIGDGDHGTNLARGLGRVAARRRELPIGRSAPPSRRRRRSWPRRRAATAGGSTAPSAWHGGRGPGSGRA